MEGGSTITQQLAKNTYFTQNKEINRKIAEMFMAWKYEKECEKYEILENSLIDKEIKETGVIVYEK